VSGKVYDITPAITWRMSVWPGDTAFSREMVCAIEKGATVTLSALRSTVHLGAHADGPVHYGAGAEGVGERDLRYFLGPCQVVTAKVERGKRVRVEDVAGGVEAVRRERVLIRTGTFPSFESWNGDFAGLSAELVEALAARGVITVGVDTPSVDLQDSKDLPAHKAVLKHDMSILEGLDLKEVPDGQYELIALPLKLIGFDGSPVRAVLREL
jgi:arylformamidase